MEHVLNNEDIIASEKKLKPSLSTMFLVDTSVYGSYDYPKQCVGAVYCTFDKWGDHSSYT